MRPTQNESISPVNFFQMISHYLFENDAYNVYYASLKLSY
jgi:hypothetical protein